MGENPTVALREEREAAFSELEAVTSKATAEGRGALTDEERAAFQAAQAKVDDLDERIAQVESLEARRAKAGEKALEDRKGGVQVTSEPRTYNPDNARTGVSFLRDVMYRSADPSAADRLRRHMTEAQHNELRGVELRDVGTGAFAGLTVPQYLTDLVAPHAKAGAPTLALVNRHPLPADGMTVNISRITTGSGVAAQASESAGVNETNMDDTLLTVNVRTYAGMQDVSRQAIDRGTGVDAIVVDDLTRQYFTVLDDAILNADGTSGTHLGIRSTASIVSVSYTDGTPTAAELYPKLFDLTQQIQAGVYAGLSHFVMHPRRFWWISSQVGTSFPFLQFFSNAQGAGGSVDSLGYGQGPSGNIGGIPVVVDANMKTNLGGGTEDVILGVSARELHFWEDAGAPLLIRTEEAAADLLNVRFVLYGYSAFTAGRYPGAQGTISGTGLAAPTF
jgi:HK97 family phage major capsid protein